MVKIRRYVQRSPLGLNKLSVEHLTYLYNILVEKSSWHAFSAASSVKSEQQQQQKQQKAGVPVAKSKKRQPVTPAEAFQDSDPEDDYDKS